MQSSDCSTQRKSWAEGDQERRGDGAIQSNTRDSCPTFEIPRTCLKRTPRNGYLREAKSTEVGPAMGLITLRDGVILEPRLRHCPVCSTACHNVILDNTEPLE